MLNEIRTLTRGFTHQFFIHNYYMRKKSNNIKFSTYAQIPKQRKFSPKMAFDNLVLKCDSDQWTIDHITVLDSIDVTRKATKNDFRN